MMKFLRDYRYLVFSTAGKSRFKRIIACIFVIAMIWTMADAISGSLTFNLWHDVICIMLGIVAEMLIPWGKDESREMKRLRRENHQLLKAVKEANRILQYISDHKSKTEQKEV